LYRSNPITWPVDIRSAVNRGFCAAPRPPGLAEAVGTSPDLQGIQPGRIRVFDLEFSLLDPSANKGKSIFALRKGDAAFAESAAVAFGRECDWIYILNSGLWMDRHGVVGHVWIVYADQTRERIDITEGVHMAYIWRGPGLASAVRVRLAGVGPEGGDGFFYATALKNPHPDRRIHELVFSAAEGAPQKPIWFVLAVCAGQGSNAIGAETAAYTVDTATVAGPVRRLNGVNLGPPLSLQLIGCDITDYLRDLNIPIMRLHDAPYESGNVVDIHNIFPLFHADHTQPENYLFGPTDDYIANCLATGSQVMFRLGESIELTRNKYYVHPPKDYRKWAEICANIVAHYNDGWANGFHHDIKYWVIWCEPENMPRLWTGTWQEFMPLYITTAKLIKKRFPTVKVGGCGFYLGSDNLIRELLAECQRASAPMDFLAWNVYTSHPDALIDSPAHFRKLLDALGFKDTELVISEWHRADFDWPRYDRDREYRYKINDQLNNVDSAVFITDVLCGLQDTPIDMATYYAATTFEYGLFERRDMPNKCYYGMLAFGLLAKYPERLQVKADNPGFVKLLAGRKADDSCAVLVSCFKSSTREISINLNAVRLTKETCSVRVIDSERNLEPVAALEISGSTLTLKKPAGSAAFLVEWKPNP